MLRTLLGLKASSETKFIAAVDFRPYLISTDTLASATCTASVYSGTDASPSAILSGAVAINSPNAGQAYQFLTGGTLGVTYELKFVGTTTLGFIKTIVAYLTVGPDLP